MTWLVKTVTTAISETYYGLWDKGEQKLDPLDTLIQLAVIAYSPLQTKLAVGNDRISKSESGVMQCVWRTLSFDHHSHLEYLRKPLERACSVLDVQGDSRIAAIFEASIEGLNRLEWTYQSKPDAVKLLREYQQMLQTSLKRSFSSLEEVTGREHWEDQFLDYVTRMLRLAKQHRDNQKLCTVITNCIQSQLDLIEQSRTEGGLQEDIEAKLRVVQKEAAIQEKWDDGDFLGSSPQIYHQPSYEEIDFQSQGYQQAAGPYSNPQQQVPGGNTWSSPDDFGDWTVFGSDTSTQQGQSPQQWNHKPFYTSDRVSMLLNSLKEGNQEDDFNPYPSVASPWNGTET